MVKTMSNDFSEFRSSISVIRKTTGSYIKGLWVEGAETTFTIQADVQSWQHEQLQALAEGRRLNQTSKMYVNQPLQALASGNPDIVLLDGNRYEVLACYPWQHGLINHYKIELQKCEQGL
jgi:hypothetical protein